MTTVFIDQNLNLIISTFTISTSQNITTNITIPTIPILITSGIPLALCVLVPNLCFLNLLRPSQLDAVQEQPPQEQPPEQEPPPPPVRIPGTI